MGESRTHWAHSDWDGWKMRIAIITIGNIYRLPYIEKYIDLVPDNVSIDIICWNRESVEETHGRANVISFDHTIKGTSVEKVKGYLAYRQFVKRQLSRNRYERIVVTPTQTGLLLSDLLTKRYENKYIFDVRDYCHEGYRFVRRLENQLVENAYETVISSEGYKAFLPDGEDYVLVHNDRVLDRTKVEEIRERKRNKGQLTIACIGYIAYHEQHKRLIDLFKNDSRFHLLFAGAGSEGLDTYCKRVEAHNVEVRGAFSPSEILDIYSTVDIVNGIYGDNCPELDYALSNKLYFAAELRMPVIANAGTYMEEVSSHFCFGVGLNMHDPEAKDKLFDFYRAIDWTRLDEGCRLFLDKVNEENNRFRDTVSKFFSFEEA